MIGTVLGLTVYKYTHRTVPIFCFVFRNSCLAFGVCFNRDKESFVSCEFLVIIERKSIQRASVFLACENKLTDFPLTQCGQFCYNKV